MPKQGYITPSGFKAMLTSGKGGEEFGLTALKYADEIALGTFGIEAEESGFTPSAIQWGLDNEGLAEQEYKRRFMCDIQPFAGGNWIQHKTLSFVGGHVDGGYVGKDGLIEIKCPYNPLNHLDNIRTGKQFDTLYKAQIQGYLWIADKKWIDCVSYDPRYPVAIALHCVRVERDDAFIAELEAKAVKFWAIVQAKKQEIENLIKGAQND
jgi:hypothetical protein